MGESVPFGSSAYWWHAALLLFGRSMDFVSTWAGSPTLHLEGNPISKMLGWRWAIPVNALICFALPHWPLTALIVATMSVLLAAHNFELAWLMRTLGESEFGRWFSERRAETPVSLYLGCLAARTALTMCVGGALVWASGAEQELTFGIGMGIITYSLAVAIYSVLSLWRNRRAMGTK
ncbi:MAG TPA: hypothetical protein VGE41_11855 [Verrucomicrobiae bacterium]